MQAAGQSPRRVDAVAKVTGQANYAIDASVPDMLFGHVVRAERAHAQILGIDVQAALDVPGVSGVVTAADLEGLFPRYGHIKADHPILAIDKVRFYGEPVALVIADTPHAASDAAEAVRVRYQDLPFVTDPDAALAPDAPLLHDTDYPAGDDSFGEAMSERRTDNIAHEATLEWGDLDAEMAKADLVLETAVKYPMLYAYAMEPYNAVASFSDRSLEVTTTAQHPYMVREDLARIFHLPLSSVRVVSPYLGGGYGSKSYTKVEPLAAVGSWYVGRPVKVALDVEGAVLTTRADSAEIRVRSGFDRSGRILAREFDLTFNTGAYADNGPLVLTKAVHRCFGPYEIPALRVNGRAVYTNTVPSSSYRGFGAPQGNLAGEMNIDQAADRLGLDPAEMRKRNLLRPGATVIPGKRPLDADLPADLDMVTDALEWSASEREPWSGKGFGCSVSDAGAFPVSTAQVRVLADGSVLLLSGSTEMGQGSRTALGQIVAEELGIDLDRVRVIQSDTSSTPYERTTGASRTTVTAGIAIMRACEEVRAKLEAMAAEVYGCGVEEVKTAEGIVRVPDVGDVPFDELVRAWFGSRAGEVTGTGVVRRTGDLEMLPPFWEVGMVGVEISVDPDTGTVSVEHLVTVGDVGFAINPRLVEGQDLGAATQGLGAALHEQLIYDGSQLINPNVVEYRVPRTRDLPARISTLLAERQDGIGPYGAKGGGEGSLNPIGGAVAAAVGRAVGRWPDRLPLTPEVVWRLIGEDEGDSS